MTTLQIRLAQADKPSRELLVECYAAVFGAPSLEWRTEDDRARRFTAMLDAEAWTSAVEMLVEMLVQEGWFFDVPIRPAHHTPSASYTHPEKIERGIWYYIEAQHRVNALAIACLKAWGL